MMDLREECTVGSCGDTASKSSGIFSASLVGTSLLFWSAKPRLEMHTMAQNRCSKLLIVNTMSNACMFLGLNV